MDDETLLNIALIVAIIGIISLFLMSYYQIIPEYDLNDITSSTIGKKVKITGMILRAYSHEAGTTITLQSECTIDVSTQDPLIQYAKGLNVTITGIVEEYDGRINIRAETIDG